jgi:hypothetical protein
MKLVKPQLSDLVRVGGGIFLLTRKSYVAKAIGAYLGYTEYVSVMRRLGAANPGTTPNTGAALVSSEIAPSAPAAPLALPAVPDQSGDGLATPTMFGVEGLGVLLQGYALK